jgi:hypothetical protein
MAFIIVSRFAVQTALIAALGIMWTPIFAAVAYDTTLYDTATIQELALRDAFWYFGMIMVVIAQTGNIIWLYVELRKEKLAAQGF